MGKKKQLSFILLGDPLWILLLGIATTFQDKFISFPWHPYVMAGFFFSWPLRWWLQGTVTQATPLTWSVYVIWAWLPINLWVSADRATSWQSAGYLLFGSTLYFACINWPIAKKRPQIIAFCILIFSILLALPSPFLVVLKPFRLFHLPLYDYIQSLTLNIGETIHLNVLAGALVISFPFWVALLLSYGWTKRRWLRWVCMVGMLCVLMVVVITQSRAGYLAIGTALTLIAMIHWPRCSYIMPIIVVLLGFSIYWNGNLSLLDLFSADGSLGGWGDRIAVWTQSLSALHEFVLTGIGIGTFTTTIPLLYPLSFSIEGYPHAHNLFLQIALDLGLPGLIAYLALLINLVVMLIVTLRRAPRHTMIHTLAIGAAGSLIGMLTHGLLDAVTWGTKLSFLPWILFALITQLFLHVQEERLATAGERQVKSA